MAYSLVCSLIFVLQTRAILDDDLQGFHLLRTEFGARNHELSKIHQGKRSRGTAHHRRALTWCSRPAVCCKLTLSATASWRAAAWVNTKLWSTNASCRVHHQWPLVPLCVTLANGLQTSMLRCLLVMRTALAAMAPERHLTWLRINSGSIVYMHCSEQRRCVRLELLHARPGYAPLMVVGRYEAKILIVDVRHVPADPRKWRFHHQVTPRAGAPQMRKRKVVRLQFEVSFVGSDRVARGCSWVAVSSVASVVLRCRREGAQARCPTPTGI